VAFGVDALFMEMHEDPDRTLPDGRPLSDGPNMLRIDDLPRLLRELRRHRGGGPPVSAERTPDVRKIAERVFRLEAEAILGLIPKLDARFERAVELLRGCSGRVIVDRHGQIGTDRTQDRRDTRVDGDAGVLPAPGGGRSRDLGMVARGDVVLALSNSGETDEVLAILPPLKRLGVPIVLLTGNPTSSLARQCEIVLDVSVAEEACPMNLAPTSSTTAALAAGDALALALLDLRGLRPEDYAALHPRGTLGWRALFRVAT